VFRLTCLFFCCLFLSTQAAVIKIIDVRPGAILGLVLDEGTAQIGEQYYLSIAGPSDGSPVVCRVESLQKKHALLKGRVSDFSAGMYLVDSDWFVVRKLIASSGNMKYALAHTGRAGSPEVFRDSDALTYEQLAERVSTVLAGRRTQVADLVSSGKISPEQSSLFMLDATLGDFCFIIESDYTAALKYYLEAIKAPGLSKAEQGRLCEACGDCQFNQGSLSEAAAFYSRARTLGVAPQRLSRKLNVLQQHASKGSSGSTSRTVSDGLRQKLVKSAAALLGKRWTHGTRVRGKPFRYDCSGTVGRICWENGIDLYRRASSYPGANGVKIIYNTYHHEGRLYFTKVPRPGDLVFFDNTYDRNRDGRWNDKLVHIGIVEKIDADNTITFIHHCSKGVSRYRMNLFFPDTYQRDGRVLNSFIRRKRPGQDPAGSSYVAGSFFAGFASIDGPPPAR
jgi:cell wall-associated NlpC family hydrolase